MIEYTNQGVLAEFLREMAKLKPSQKYFLVGKEYAPVFYSLLKHGFESGAIRHSVGICVSFFYTDDSVVAFQIEGKDILRYPNGKIRFFKEHAERLNEILTVIPVLETPEEDRLTYLENI